MIYVLTSEVNEYDQYGEYFFFAWDHPPEIDELRETLLECTENLYNDDYLHHILNKGGQMGCEHRWYWIREVKT